MKKIGIIGSSLISCLYAYRLARKNKVYIFEHQNIGGAWQNKVLSGKSQPVFNNIICALKEEEEKYINAIKEELISMGGEVKIYHQDANLSCGYRPRKYIIGNYTKLYREVIGRKNIMLSKKEIKKIEAKRNYVGIDQEKFDIVLLPNNYNIEEIQLDGDMIRGNTTTHISKHLRVTLEELIDKRNYSENFDNIFDRGGVNRFTHSGYLFIGRVRKERKGECTESLIEKSDILKKYRHKIKEVELNEYSHQYSDESDKINKLIKARNYNILAIKTRQFVDGYANMLKDIRISE